MSGSALWKYAATPSAEKAELISRVVVLEEGVRDARAVRRFAQAFFPAVQIESVRSLKPYPDSATGRDAVIFLFVSNEISERGAAESVAAFRSHSECNANCPVVMLSNDLEKEAALRAIAAGVDEIVIRRKLKEDTFHVAIAKAMKAWRRRLTTQRQAEQQLRLSRMLAHDMRNPISAIRWAAEDILNDDTGLSEPTSRKLQLVHRASQEALSIIQRKLEEIQLDVSSTGEVLTRAEMLLEIIDQMRILHAIRLQQAGGIIEVGPLGDLPVSIFSMRNILLNLIDNSIKYHSDAALRIEIHADPACGAPNLVYRDNGSGIAKQQIERIFDQDATSTGNGLRFIADLVQSEGGVVACDSDGQSFTEFRMTF